MVVSKCQSFCESRGLKVTRLVFIWLFSKIRGDKVTRCIFDERHSHKVTKAIFYGGHSGKMRGHWVTKVNFHDGHPVKREVMRSIRSF